MSDKVHNVLIYQNPRQGTGFLAQYAAGGYRHRVLAKGGDDTASFVLQLTPGGAEVAFEQYLGSIVRVFVDNTEEPIWEGYIDRMTWRTGGITVTRGFENMSNRVNVTFYNADSPAANKVENTTVVQAANSILTYGLKEGAYDAGVHYDNANKTHKLALRDLFRTVYNWPQVSAAAAAGGDGILEIECKGLQYYVWDWQNYDNPAGITQPAYTAFYPLVDPLYAAGAYMPDNAPYIYRTGSSTLDAYRYITLNSAFQVSLKSEGGQTYLQYIQGVVEAGDGQNRYIFGITKPIPGDGRRYIYYRPADVSIRYTTYAFSDAGRLRDVYGQAIDPWRVTPDAGIRINDILIGWDQRGDDPRIGYIEAIEYDADAGTVQWQTGDDITLEGAMQRTKRYKKFKANDPFAAQPRRAV